MGAEHSSTGLVFWNKVAEPGVKIPESNKVVFTSLGKLLGTMVAYDLELNPSSPLLYNARDVDDFLERRSILDLPEIEKEIGPRIQRFSANGEGWSNTIQGPRLRGELNRYPGTTFVYLGATRDQRGSFASELLPGLNSVKVESTGQIHVVRNDSSAQAINPEEVQRLDSLIRFLCKRVEIASLLITDPNTLNSEQRAMLLDSSDIAFIRYLQEQQS